MVRPIQPSKDPNAQTTYKKCKCCGVEKLILEFPLSYRKPKKSDRITYKTKCLVCERLEQKKMWQNRQLKKLIILFDGSEDQTTLEAEGAGINNPNIVLTNDM